MEEDTLSTTVETVTGAGDYIAAKAMAGKDIRFTAINLLARRENFRVALQRKLFKRFSDQ